MLENRDEFLEECRIYDEMRKLSPSLSLVIVQTILRLKVGGVLVTERHTESLTRNSYNKMSCFPYGAMDAFSTYIDGSLGMKQTSGSTVIETRGPPLGIAQTNIEAGVPVDIGPSPVPMGYFADATDDTSSIVAGTDSTAESIDDFEMGSLIADGAGAGQMDYAAMTFTDGFNSPYYWSVWSRILTNNTAGTITAEEVGIIFRHNTFNLYKFLMIRDLTGGVAIVPAGTLEIQYETRVGLS